MKYPFVSKVTRESLRGSKKAKRLSTSYPNAQIWIALFVILISFEICNFARADQTCGKLNAEDNYSSLNNILRCIEHKIEGMKAVNSLGGSSKCWAEFNGSEKIRGCVTAVNRSEADTTVHVEFENKSKDTVIIVADNTNRLCGAILSDNGGTKYDINTSGQEQQATCSMTAVSRTAPPKNLREYLLDVGHELAPGESTSATYVHLYRGGKNVEVWSMSVSLLFTALTGQNAQSGRVSSISLQFGEIRRPK